MRKIIFNHQKWIRLLISFLCISVNSWGQYQGYLGQSIDLPMPTSAPAGYQVVPGSGIYTPASGITSDYIAIRSGTSTAVIIKYTEYTLNVNCEYEVVKQWYVGTKLYEDHKTLKTTYTINCLPIRISGFPTSEISMEASEKKSVSIDYSPKYGLSPNFEWETSDDKVVDYEGAGSSIELIAKKEGSATIKLSSIGGPAQYFSVNVKGTPPNPSSKLSLSANPTGGSVESGTKVYLTASVDGSTVSDADIYYTTDETTPSKSSMKYTSSGISITKACTLKAIAYKDGYETSSVGSWSYTISSMSKLTLSANPPGGSVESGTIVYLATSADGTTISGADIYYTTDGTTPSKSSMKYTSSGISITKACTLKAIAYKDGYETSSVGSWSYTIASKPKLTLSANPPGGSVESGTIVFLTTSADGTTISGADIYYTTNGSTPSKSSSKYTSSGISINNTTTIKAIAYKDGFIESDVLMENYTIIPNSGLDLSGIQIASQEHSVVLKGDGSLWACGRNNNGQIGDGTTNNSNSFVKVMENVDSVAIGNYGGYTLALKKDGTLWGWGYNDGTINGQYTSISTPTKIMDDVRKFAAEDLSRFAIKKDGSLWMWGQQINEDSGPNTKSMKMVFPPQKLLDDVVDVQAGDCYAHVLKNDGTLWAYGYNGSGQLGDGTNMPRLTPVKIMDDVLKVIPGDYHTFVIKRDQSLWGFGSNPAGALGVGTTENQYSPVRIKSNVKSVIACGRSTFIIDTNNRLYVCGDNHFGRLGTGDKNDLVSPHKIMEDVKNVASSEGYQSTFILKEDNSLWGCGWNYFGVLGMGYSEEQLTPIKIADEVVMINSIFDFCAFYLKKDGTLWASGDNSYGAMGMGNNQRWSYTSVKVMEDIFGKSSFDITTSTSGYATFFDSQSSYILPNGLSAQVVTNAANGKLTYKTITDGSVSGVVPKGTAVMLASDNKQSGTYTLTATESGASYSGTNLLRGSDEAQMTTGDGYHYKLSYGKSGTTWSDVFGWYWGADNGGSFMTEGHKAWLVVPKSAATTRGYSVDGETTGISTLELSEDAAVYYDLQGRRITQPTTKGVYIKNGKKVMVK